MSTVELLRSSASRKKVHDAQMVLKLPAEAKGAVQQAARDQGVSDAAVVRLAIAEYLERRGY